jgi:hypothetical protein
MKNGVFWDVTPCGSCKTHTSATGRNIPEDTILQCWMPNLYKIWLQNKCYNKNITRQTHIFLQLTPVLGYMHGKKYVFFNQLSPHFLQISLIHMQNKPRLPCYHDFHSSTIFTPSISIHHHSSSVWTQLADVAGCSVQTAMASPKYFAVNMDENLLLFQGLPLSKQCILYSYIHSLHDFRLMCLECKTWKYVRSALTLE